MSFDLLSQTNEPDHVLIEDMRLPARIGVYAHEKAAAQVLGVSLRIGLAQGRAGYSDDLHHTIDYAQVAHTVRRLAMSQHFNLVECLAERICHLVLLDFGAPWATVRIHKYGVILDVERVGVQIMRTRGDLDQMAVKAEHLRSEQRESLANSPGTAVA